LTEFNVTGANFNLTAKVGEPNLSGFVYIPNQSIMTIAMVSDKTPYEILVLIQTGKCNTVPVNSSKRRYRQQYHLQYDLSARKQHPSHDRHPRPDTRHRKHQLIWLCGLDHYRPIRCLQRATFALLCQSSSIIRSCRNRDADFTPN
jgi:hypothetical protein